MPHTLTNISNQYRYDHDETISCDKVDSEIYAAKIQTHLFSGILHTRPGLAELDYSAVVYSIIFCNGISAVRKANWRRLSRSDCVHRLQAQPRTVWPFNVRRCDCLRGPNVLARIEG